MLMRLLSAVVVAVVVYLLCILIGGVILQAIPLSVVQAIGGFIDQWAEVIALLAGIWHFIGGGNVFTRFKKTA